MGERDNHGVEKMVGQRIRRYRELRGWSVRQLAREAGIAHPALLRIERGQGMLPVGTLDKLARALGLLLSDLVREDDREALERAEKLLQIAAIMQRRKQLEVQGKALQTAQERWGQEHARLEADASILGIAEQARSCLEYTFPASFQWDSAPLAFAVAAW